MTHVSDTAILGSAPKETTCEVAGCPATEVLAQGLPAADGGAEIWARCARHLVRPSFVPLATASGLAPTCEVGVDGVPCGAMATHVSLFSERLGSTERLGIVAACPRHAVRAW